MGFSTTVAQLVSAPPYVAAAVTAVVFALASDRFYWRMPFVALPLMLVTIGYSIVLSLDGALASKKGVAYFSIVLAVMGIYPIQAAAASWNANNIAPAARRSIGIALAQGCGNLGGIVGSYSMYRHSERDFRINANYSEQCSWPKSRRNTQRVLVSASHLAHQASLCASYLKHSTSS